MKKTLKVTTGILVGALTFTGTTNLNEATAQGVVKINVEEKNDNITTQIIEENGKNYITVTAHKDVNNVYVRAKASNNQNFVFKLEKLSAGKTEKFEVKLADVKVDAKKALPKTSVVKETVKFNGYIGEVKLAVEVTYEVEKEETVTATPENPTSPATKPEEKPVTPETPEAKPTTPATSETKPETTTAGKELTAEEIKAAEEALKNEAENKGTETTTPATTEVKAEETSATTEVKSETKPTTPVTTEVKAEEKPVTPVVTTPVSSGTSTRSAVQVTPTVAKAANVTSTTQTAQVVGTSSNAVASQVAQLINEYRKDNKLPTFSVNTALLSGTKVRAQEFITLINSGKVGSDLHKRLNGESWNTAFAGGAKGEILAVSSNGAEGLLNFWKGSPLHNEEMKNPKHTSFTVEVVEYAGQYYGVVIFS